MIADPHAIPQLAARALQIADRINTAGFEGQVLSATPLAVRIGETGVAVVFRYGVVVFIGLSVADELNFLDRLSGRLFGPIAPPEEETAKVQVAGESEEPIPVGGPILVKELSLERLLIVADALAKSVVLGRSEREIANVFDTIEPFARELAALGRTSKSRVAMLKLLGAALLVQHRVSGRVAVGEKPDVLWDRPDLERLYARLEDEYELKEREETLNRKLAVIAETATALADIIDTKRSLRLEISVVLLIACVIVLGFYEIFARSGH
ncbi:RMD1 family protein [Bradyrhizobium sp.]|uniref:RMD1 family protein n=1 Tax=Bradyrhizobium sp. TaxID=376 RepID=UPI0028FFAC7F|nr:RMD1 family protein [Bradyrhizobium sp.]MDU3046205.1 RMD1 family protein [Bradyrhizobium sp.]